MALPNAVKWIRFRLGLSQSGFSNRYGVPLATLKNWEQGRKKMDAASSLLIHLIDKFPDQIAAEVELLRKKNK